MSDQYVKEHLAEYGGWLQRSSGLDLSPSEDPAMLIEAITSPKPGRARQIVLVVAAAVIAMVGAALILRNNSSESKSSLSVCPRVLMPSPTWPRSGSAHQDPNSVRTPRHSTWRAVRPRFQDGANYTSTYLDVASTLTTDGQSITVETATSPSPLLGAGALGGQLSATRIKGAEGWTITRLDADGEWNGIAW